MNSQFAKYGSGLVFCWLLACSSVPPPTDQVALAKSAVNDAISAGAAEAAPAELATAQSKIEGMNKALLAEDNSVARRLAEQAQVDARIAAVKARSAKADKAAQEIEQSNSVLRDEINRTRR